MGRSAKNSSSLRAALSRVCYVSLIFVVTLTLRCPHATSIEGEVPNEVETAEYGCLRGYKQRVASTQSVCSPAETSGTAMDVRADALLLWSCATDSNTSGQVIRTFLFNHTVYSYGGTYQMSQLVQMYANTSEVPLNVKSVDPDWWNSQLATTYIQPADLAASMRQYAGWALAPPALSGMYDNDLLQPLDKLLPLIPALSAYWQDIPEVFRDVAGVYDGNVVSIPYTAEVPLLFWRRDLFKKLGLSPPSSWEETLAVARRINGTEVPCISNSSQPCVQYGFCFGLPYGCFYEGLSLTAIWASMVGAYGTKAGLYFDAVTMQPLFTGPAMAEALRIFQELSALGPPAGRNCDRLSEAFYLQRCMFALSVTSLIKTFNFAFGRKLAGQIGVSMLPGSHLVQNRTTGQLEECTKTLCPYATPITSAVHNGTVLINRVPYLGRGALSLAINRHAPPNHALASLRAFVYALTYEGGWPLALDPTTRTSPVRARHLSPENIKRWTDAGYEREDTLSFLSVMAESMSHPCLASGFRATGCVGIETAMGEAATAVLYNGTSPAELLGFLRTRYSHVLDTYYGGEAPNLQRAYWRDIGYRTSQQGGLQGLQSQRAASGGHGGLSSLGIVGVVVAGSAVAVLAVLAAAVLVHHKRRSAPGSNRKLHPVQAPSYSPDTSLCITDIQSSTALWEALEAAVMDEALSLHNDCIRSLLPKHHGYECHTEGDSFIIAFPSATSAVAFALEMQVSMMQLPWSEPLLRHEACSALYHIASTAAVTQLGVANSVLGAGPDSGAPASEPHSSPSLTAAPQQARQQPQQVPYTASLLEWVLSGRLTNPSLPNGNSKGNHLFPASASQLAVSPFPPSLSASAGAPTLTSAMWPFSSKRIIGARRAAAGRSHLGGQHSPSLLPSPTQLSTPGPSLTSPLVQHGMSNYVINFEVRALQALIKKQSGVSLLPPRCNNNTPLPGDIDHAHYHNHHNRHQCDTSVHSPRAALKERDRASYNQGRATSIPQAAALVAAARHSDSGVGAISSRSTFSATLCRLGSAHEGRDGDSQDEDEDDLDFGQRPDTSNIDSYNTMNTPAGGNLQACPCDLLASVKGGGHEHLGRLPSQSYLELTMDAGVMPVGETHSGRVLASPGGSGRYSLSGGAYSSTPQATTLRSHPRSFTGGIGGVCCVDGSNEALAAVTATTLAMYERDTQVASAAPASLLLNASPRGSTKGLSELCAPASIGVSLQARAPAGSGCTGVMMQSGSGRLAATVFPTDGMLPDVPEDAGPISFGDREALLVRRYYSGAIEVGGGSDEDGGEASGRTPAEGSLLLPLQLSPLIHDGRKESGTLLVGGSHRAPLEPEHGSVKERDRPGGEGDPGDGSGAEETLVVVPTAVPSGRPSTPCSEHAMAGATSTFLHQSSPSSPRCGNMSPATLRSSPLAGGRGNGFRLPQPAGSVGLVAAGSPRVAHDHFPAVLDDRAPVVSPQLLALPMQAPSPMATNAMQLPHRSFFSGCAALQLDVTGTESCSGNDIRPLSSASLAESCLPRVPSVAVAAMSAKSPAVTSMGRMFSRLGLVASSVTAPPQAFSAAVRPQPQQPGDKEELHPFGASRSHQPSAPAMLSFVNTVAVSSAAGKPSGPDAGCSGVRESHNLDGDADGNTAISAADGAYASAVAAAASPISRSRPGLSRPFLDQVSPAVKRERMSGPGGFALGSPITAANSTFRRSIGGALPYLRPNTGTGATQASFGQSSGPGVLCFRGFRVRVGICSGLVPGRDVVYRKDLSGRMAYSGACMQLTKLISDAAIGGMVLLGNSTVERLMPLARRDIHGLIIWHKGRFTLEGLEAGHSKEPHRYLRVKQMPPSHGMEPQDLYQAMASSLAARQLLLERMALRTLGQVLPGVLAAPLGCVTLAMVQVVGVATLMEWNEAVARESLSTLHSAALAQLRALGGYPAVLEGGLILAAFTSAPTAMRWLLALEEDLRCNVPWPPELLGHELGDELLVTVPAPAMSQPQYGGGGNGDEGPGEGGNCSDQGSAGRLGAVSVDGRKVDPAAWLFVTGGGGGGGGGGRASGAAGNSFGSAASGILRRRFSMGGMSATSGLNRSARTRILRNMVPRTVDRNSPTDLHKAPSVGSGRRVSMLGDRWRDTGSHRAALGGIWPEPLLRPESPQATAAVLSLIPQTLTSPTRLTPRRISLHRQISRLPPLSLPLSHTAPQSLMAERLPNGEDEILGLPARSNNLGGRDGSCGDDVTAGLASSEGDDGVAATFSGGAVATLISPSKPCSFKQHASTAPPDTGENSTAHSAPLTSFAIPFRRSSTSLRVISQRAGQSPHQHRVTETNIATGLPVGVMVTRSSAQLINLQASLAQSSQALLSTNSAQLIPRTQMHPSQLLLGALASPQRTPMSSELPASPTDSPLVPTQHRVLRGLRVRCAAEEGSFAHDGSISAARLYRSQQGGRPYARLSKLCSSALMGRVLCSWAVAKRIHRAAAAGDPAAQMLRLTALSAAGAGGGNNGRTAAIAGATRTGGDADAMAAAAAAAIAWNAAEADDEWGPEGCPSRTGGSVELPGFNKADVWMCTLARGGGRGPDTG